MGSYNILKERIYLLGFLGYRRNAVWKVKSGYKNVWDKEKLLFSLRRKVREIKIDKDRDDSYRDRDRQREEGRERGKKGEREEKKERGEERGVRKKDGERK